VTCHILTIPVSSKEKIDADDHLFSCIVFIWIVNNMQYYVKMQMSKTITITKRIVGEVRILP
jgi:hypothetical protein